MKRALVAALLSALATGAVLATVGFGANSNATTASKNAFGRSAAYSFSCCAPAGVAASSLVMLE